MRALFQVIFRRPDLWIGFVTLAIVVPVYSCTSLSFRTLDRTLLSHLTDSFGVGVISMFVAVFVQLLLRAAPAPTARTLRLGWLGLVVVTTLGLLFSFANPTRTSTNWILQSLVLAVLGWSLVLTALLFACGLVRGSDLRNAARELARHWGGIVFYLATGGYLLTIIRAFSPEVFDPLLLKMDASLGPLFVSAIKRWSDAHPVARFLTDYAYPMLGFFIAAVGARLHLAGEFTPLRRYLTAVVFVAFLGPVFYWALPAVGPVYAYPELFSKAAPPPDVVAHVLTGPATTGFRMNVMRNVFPSLHTTFTLVALAALWPRRRGVLLWLPLVASQIITTLTHGVHYVIDLIAAVPLAVLAWSLAEVATRRCPPTDAPPLLPLPDQERRTRHLAATFAASVVALSAWALAAPISPLLAWPLTLVILSPGVAAIRLFRVAPAPRANVATPRAAPVAPAANFSPARLLAGAVFCTGGTALILEQVAEKYLSTLVGASRPATTLVLVVYFVGLALGAALCPKNPAGATRRLAALELFVAAWCALLALAFFSVDRALGEWLARQDSSALTLAAARTAVAALWLLPPMIAMGAQLPTLAAALRGAPEFADVSLPRLYALNLAGACCFCFAAPVFLFNAIGANGALWFTAGLAALVGLTLWSGLPRAASTTAATPPRTNTPAARPAPAALALSFGSGFAFFALEIVWFHLISAVCGASTYSFSLLLGLILAALTLAARRSARADVPSLASTCAALAVVLALSNAGWPWAGRALATAQSALSLEWFWAGELLKTLVVALLVLPPAVLLGQIFPRLLRDASADGAHVGRLSFANILGCVTGALAAGFLLIPQLGAEHTLLAAALLAAGAAFVQFRTLPRRSLALAATGVALALFLPAWNRLELTRGYGVYLTSGLPGNARLAWFREDFTAGFVTVTTHPDARGHTIKTLLQNGKFDADDADEAPAQISFGLIAALHAPSTERALVIGAGSGQTAAVVAQLGFAHVDIAELSPAHLAAARAEFSHLHHGVFDRPNVTVHVEDGRNLLLRTRTPYDVIQIEITSLWFAGATNLYSREFYALARSRLAAGGALVQWIQLHHLAPREIATILATARAEFPHVAVWIAGQQACLVASAQPPRVNLPVWQRWLSDPALATARKATGIVSPETLAPSELLTAPRVAALLDRYRGAYGLNTDRNRWIEFQTPKYYLSRFDHRAANLRWLASAPP